MEDIKLLETCGQCGAHLVLMGSISYPGHELWAVKRCLTCGRHPVEEVVRLHEEEKPCPH